MSAAPQDDGAVVASKPLRNNSAVILTAREVFELGARFCRLQPGWVVAKVRPDGLHRL
jgi:hypothetical protein